MAIVFLIVFYAFRLARLAEAETESLLRNMMPGVIVDRLKDDPNTTIAENFEEASVLFADLRGFTQIAQRLGPAAHGYASRRSLLAHRSRGAGTRP